MTMQPPLAQPLPQLDVNNPWQMAEYFGRWLFMADPAKFAESVKRIAERARHWAEDGVEKGMLMHGFKRGNPQERWDAYVRKYMWPKQTDPATGALLHPVMTQQPVIDPETGLPTGQVQDVPSEIGEDLWDLQLKMFPRQFLVDARDAFDMGAPLEPWVKELVLETVVSEQAPGGKKALRDAVAGPAYKKALVAA